MQITNGKTLKVSQLGSLEGYQKTISTNKMLNRGTLPKCAFHAQKLIECIVDCRHPRTSHTNVLGINI